MPARARCSPDVLMCCCCRGQSELAALGKRLQLACQQYLASRQGGLLVVPGDAAEEEEEAREGKPEVDAATESAAIMGGICRIAADAGRKPDIEEGIA